MRSLEYYYSIYGLIVKSEIELPEAYEILETTAVDVTIGYGNMPEFILNKKSNGSYSSVFQREYSWVYYENEGDFLMLNGREIVVTLAKRYNIKHIRAIILGTCLGNILYQRETIAIHGGAVVFGDKAVVVSGVSGAGKSTVSLALREKGGVFLADDTVVAIAEEDYIYAYPGYPQQKMCKDTTTRFGFDINTLIELEEERDKYALQLTEEEFCNIKKPIHLMAFLDITDDEELVVEELQGNNKLQYLLQNQYAIESFRRGGLNKNIFRKCIECANRVKMILITRPKGKDYSDEISNIIINNLEG
ncbi:hypothetical protein [Anaerosporobacter sp.]